MGVSIDTKLSFAQHIEHHSLRNAFTSFDTCGQRDVRCNAEKLVHAPDVQSCPFNSLLYSVAVVHLRPLQSVINAAARLRSDRHA